MKHLLFAGALVAAAGQGQALSCVPPDAARAFQTAQSADGDYVALLGTFTFTAPDRRNGTLTDAEDQIVVARFTGQSLGATRFQDIAPRDVTLVFQCFSVWCGGIDPEAGQILTFAELTDEGLVVRADPCGSTVFVRPSAGDVARVEACMRGAACAPADR